MTQIDTSCDKTWIGSTANFKHGDKPAFSDINLQHVHEQAMLIYEELKRQFTNLEISFDIELTLRKAATDPRLQRGINERGLIAPDFGKPYKGLYFQKVLLQLHSLNRRSQDERQSIEKTLQALLVQYWIDHPSDYSNWELSYRNPRPVKSFNGIKTAMTINFPLIEVENF
jgi:hypothetical protein